jgi:hypothetical protein
MDIPLRNIGNKPGAIFHGPDLSILQPRKLDLKINYNFNAEKTVFHWLTSESIKS